MQLRRLDAHIRDNSDAITEFLEEAALAIECMGLSRHSQRGQRVRQMLRGALRDIHSLMDSEEPDLAAAAALERALTAICADLDALRCGIPETV